MDRYQKVEKPKPESPINEYEIRITSQGLVRNYINYANTLLQERHGKEIVLKAMGQAISKAVAIAEIIKRRVPILHQDTAISSVSITDVWEPIEEGLLPVEQTRHVSVISITLSTQELNKNSPGYQAPSEVEQMKPRDNNYQPRLQQPSPRQTRGVYYAGNEDSYGRGRGRGIGRGRGWSRGGYGNYQVNGDYSNWGRENDGYSNRGRENGGISNRGRGNGGYSNRGRGNGGAEKMVVTQTGAKEMVVTQTGAGKMVVTQTGAEEMVVTQTGAEVGAAVDGKIVTLDMEEAEVMDVDADADADAWTSVLKVVATRLSRGLAHCHRGMWKSLYLLFALNEAKVK
ncbi:hypothetical protein EJD97_017909 [Solanum chilense]|uniref:DNA/RNA-binding protein Alba-like domain-containing protein n=1 Tax=Solanum chilense TaxID=4083 RepID=A0A6N2B335_SOLCI|nr:hypothetical protein EJD97_017909 [Solanum chilense]